MDERKPFDLDALVQRATSGPCFICGLLAGDPDYRHHIVDEDEEAIIFLSKYPTLRGYCLVCPRAHCEDLAEELSEAAYLSLQARIHRLARALKRVFDAERIYVLSLGSQQANAHVHFHVVPLPRGVPLARQQYHALMAENGVLAIDDEELAQMAAMIGRAYRGLAGGGFGR
jgi:diadenosine tetraphosphate (Ap4A) HIT family hydrolase